MWRTLGRCVSVHRIKIQSDLKTVSDVLDQLDRAEQDDRADCCANDRADKTETDVDSGVAKKPMAKERTHNSDYENWQLHRSPFR